MTESPERPVDAATPATKLDEQSRQETPVESNDLTQGDFQVLLKNAQEDRLATSAAMSECRALAERLRNATTMRRLADAVEDDCVEGAPGEIGPFEFLESIGKGGMGQVWKARHRRLGKIQAVKIIHPDRTGSAEVLQRFHREMQAIGQLEHPNIVAAQHADEVDGLPFLVMEYVDGKSLSQIAKEHQSKGDQIAVDSACEWIRQAALGVDYAHRRGIVHRDIKPGNIMLDREGTVKVLDLGLARIVDRCKSEDTLTQVHQAVGTPDYMAPEQVQGSDTVDHRTDVYALGATLFYLLSGQVCFPTQGSEQVLGKAIKIAQDPAPKIRQIRSSVPKELEELIGRCLSKDPRQRPQSALALSEELKRWAAADDTSSDSHDGTSSPPVREVAGASGSFRSATMLCVLAASILLPIALLASVVYKLSLPGGGELLVEVDDPTIDVMVVAKNNAQEKRLEFSREDGGNRITLGYGTWELQLSGVEADLYELSETSVTLNRGGESIVKVEVRPALKVVEPPKPKTSATGTFEAPPQQSEKWELASERTFLPGLALQPAKVSDHFETNQILLRPVNAINDRWAWGRHHFDIDPLGKTWAYSTGSEILVRNTDSGRVEAVFVGAIHSHWQSVRYSYDGELLAAINTTERVVEIRQRDGLLTNRFSFAAAFTNQDGQSEHQFKWLPDAESILVWNSYRAVVFSCDGRVLSTIDFPANRFSDPRLPMQRYSPRSRCASVHPSGDLVTFLFGTGDVMQWYFKSGQLKKHFQATLSENHVSGLEWHPGGEKLLLWCADENDESKAVSRIYDRDGNVLHQQPRDWTIATWSPRGTHLVTDDGGILAEDLTLMKKIDLNMNRLVAPFWKIPDVIAFARCDFDRVDCSGELKRFRPSGSPIATYSSPQASEILAVSLTASGDPVAAYRQDCSNVSLGVWNRDGQLTRVHRFELHDTLSQVSWAEDGKRVGLCGRGKFLVVNLETGNVEQKMTWIHGGEIRTKFALGRKPWLAYVDQKSDELVVCESGTPVGRFAYSYTHEGPKFSPDGRWLVWHSKDKRASTLHMLDLAADKLLPTEVLFEHAQRSLIPGVAFSPDSRYLLYAFVSLSDETHREGQQCLVDLDSGKETVIVGKRGPQAPVWSPDSSRFYGGNGIFRKGTDGTFTRLGEHDPADWPVLAFFNNSNDLLTSSHRNGLPIFSVQKVNEAKRRVYSVVTNFQDYGAQPSGNNGHPYENFVVSTQSRGCLVVMDSRTGEVRWTGTKFDDGSAISMSRSGRLLHCPDQLDKYLVNVIRYPGGRTVAATKSEFDQRLNATIDDATMHWLIDHNAKYELADVNAAATRSNIARLEVEGSEVLEPPGLPNLQELCLRTPIQERIPSVLEPTKLIELDLAGCPINEVDPLSDFEQLTTLNLSSTKISAEAGGVICQLTKLRTLRLRDTKIDEFTLLDLARLPQLELLDIRGTEIPNRAVREFQQSLPLCELLID